MNLFGSTSIRSAVVRAPLSSAMETTFVRRDKELQRHLTFRGQVPRWHAACFLRRGGAAHRLSSSWAGPRGMMQIRQGGRLMVPCHEARCRHASSQANSDSPTVQDRKPLRIKEFTNLRRERTSEACNADKRSKIRSVCGYIRILLARHLNLAMQWHRGYQITVTSP